MRVLCCIFDETFGKHFAPTVIAHPRSDVRAACRAAFTIQLAGADSLGRATPRTILDGRFLVLLLQQTTHNGWMIFSLSIVDSRSDTCRSPLSSESLMHQRPIASFSAAPILAIASLLACKDALVCVT